MRFMMLIKSDARTETGATPTPEERAAMGKFNQQLLEAGVLQDTQGLKASSYGARIRFSRGKKPLVTDGPFAEAKEVVAGYWIIQVESSQAAIELAKRVPLVDGEIELRQLFELDDFPVDPAEQPESWREKERQFREGEVQTTVPNATGGRTLRFVGFIKADAQSEAGTMPTEAELTAMGRYTEQGIAAGVFIGGEGLQPSAKGAKVCFSAGKSRVIDGPFAEAKELIAGFGVMRVRSRQEAIEWSLRMPVEEGELELRELFDSEVCRPDA